MLGCCACLAPDAARAARSRPANTDWNRHAHTGRTCSPSPCSISRDNCGNCSGRTPRLLPKVQQRQNNIVTVTKNHALDIHATSVSSRSWCWTIPARFRFGSVSQHFLDKTRSMCQHLRCCFCLLHINCTSHKPQKESLVGVKC